MEVQKIITNINMELVFNPKFFHSYLKTFYHPREYALRRVRDGFRKARNLSDEADQKRELEVARESLEVIKRQVSLMLCTYI